MKHAIFFLTILIFSNFASAESLFELRDSLKGKSNPSNFFTGTPDLEGYIKLSKHASDVVCEQKNTKSLQALSGENLWREVQAMVDIQVATTVHYHQMCQDVRNNTQDFCSGSSEVISNFQTMQNCIHDATEIRIDLISKTLGRNHVINCIDKTEKIGRTQTSVSFLNTNFKDMSYDDVKGRMDLDPLYDPKRNARIDGYIIDQSNEDCKVNKDETEFNKCYYKQVVAHFNEAPPGKILHKEESFDKLRRQLKSVDYSLICADNDKAKCKRAIKNAFVLEEDKKTCEFNVDKTSSGKPGTIYDSGTVSGR